MKRDVLVVAHSRFPSDPRIRKQVGALIEAGRSVDVVCLRGAAEPARTREGSLRVLRLPVRRHRGAGLGTYAFEYGLFMVLATAAVTWLWVLGRHRVVQAHTLPDPLVFTALVPRLFGALVVLDMHELAPELFASRYRLGARHPLVRVLRLAERASCRLAHRVITVSDPVAERLVERGVARGRIGVVMNTAPVPLGPPAGRAGGATGFTLIYAGLVSELYDLGTAVQALARLAEAGDGESTLRVVGDGPALPALRRQVEALGLNGRVRFEGAVPPARVPALLAAADAALVPLAPVDYMEFSLPTKLFEALAAGLPVVTTPFRTIRRYFDDDDLCYVPAADPAALADRIAELRDAPELLRRYAERGSAAARAIAWPAQAARYLELMGMARPAARAAAVG